ncbi:MAG TPA: heavy-metal-associated domain-containing protein [Thiotrichales bacterium]|nr:heavy-metal-associated domain-containing protein [Thiotrichales bacterium]
MQANFEIQNMKCMGCVSAVKKAVEALDGVTAVEVDLEGGKATVSGDFDPEQVARVITEAGYPAKVAG